MLIKGTAFLSKKHQIVRMKGEAAWNQFMQQLAGKDAFFDQTILATTLIPYRTFLWFQDQMLAWFFDGEIDAYWMIGARSADWALKEGPYKSYLANRDIAGFVARFPNLWSTYFTVSEAKTSMTGNLIEVRAFGLPVWHPYFEYLVMGYFKRGLELLGATVEEQRVSPARALDFHYRFTLK